jgi:nucleotide-binding universal stress UspA family protein
MSQEAAMFTSILVATDGSDHAVKAVITASALATASNAKLTLVTVPQPAIDPVLVGYTTVPVPLSREELEKQGVDLLAKAAATLPEDQRDTVGQKVLFGDPAHAIVDEGLAQGVDLIVLGRRGLGRLTGLLIGSTSTKVNQLAPCAVLTVK